MRRDGYMKELKSCSCKVKTEGNESNEKHFDTSVSFYFQSDIRFKKKLSKNSLGISFGFKSTHIFALDLYVTQIEKEKL